MDRLPEDVHSKFRYVLLAANRAEQLMKGAPARVDPKKRKLTSVALEEISEGAVDWSLTDANAAANTAASAAEAGEGDEVSFDPTLEDGDSDQADA